MNRTELITVLRKSGRTVPEGDGWGWEFEPFQWATEAADMLEADGEYRAQSHEATVCREIARQQTDTVNRLSAECDTLTAQLDEARALIREVVALDYGPAMWTGKDGEVTDHIHGLHITRGLWNRLQWAVTP